MGYIQRVDAMNGRIYVLEGPQLEKPSREFLRSDLRKTGKSATAPWRTLYLWNEKYQTPVVPSYYCVVLAIPIEWVT
jgi:hypothetical protein